EELERRLLAVLLAHEEHRRVRRQQRAERRQRPGLGRKAVAERAVADLVVVLVEDDEALGRAAGRRRAELALVEARPAAVVQVWVAQDVGEVAERAELG